MIAVSLHQPAVELHMAFFLPRIAASGGEARSHADLHTGGGVLVLLHEHLHAGIRHSQQMLEHGMLQSGRVQQIADLHINAGRRLGADDEEESLIGSSADAERGRNQSEARPPAFLFGEIGKDRQQGFVGGVEAAVYVGVAVGAEDDIAAVFPRHRELCHVARAEILDDLMQPVGVVAVVEVLKHDLPVPRQVGERESARADAVGQVVVGEKRSEALQSRPQRARIRVEAHEDEAFPHFHQQLGKAVVGFVEVLGALHRRGAQQTAVQAVDPVVIGAGEGAGVACVVADLHASVLADGREHIDMSVFVAGRDYSLSVHFCGEVVACFWYLRSQAETEPLVIPEGFELKVVELLGCVELGRQGSGVRHIAGGGIQRFQQFGCEGCHSYI